MATAASAALPPFCRILIPISLAKGYTQTLVMTAVYDCMEACLCFLLDMQLLLRSRKGGEGIST